MGKSAVLTSVRAGREGKGVWLPWVVGLSHSREMGSHFPRGSCLDEACRVLGAPQKDLKRNSFRVRRVILLLAPGRPPGTTSLNTGTGHCGWAGLRSPTEEAANLSFRPCPDMRHRRRGWEPPVRPAPSPRALQSVGNLSQRETVCFLGIHVTGREECEARVFRASGSSSLPLGGVPRARPGDRNGALSGEMGRGPECPGERPRMDLA